MKACVSEEIQNAKARSGAHDVCFHSGTPGPNQLRTTDIAGPVQTFPSEIRTVQAAARVDMADGTVTTEVAIITQCACADLSPCSLNSGAP
jgi:hypothetical protein